MQNRSFLLFTAMTLVFTSAAFASLKDKKAQETGMYNIKGNIESAQTTCGIPKLDVSVDWKSFTFTEANNESHAANYCGDIVDGVRQLCSSGDTEKKAVQKDVKAIKCSYKKGMTTEKFAKEGLSLKAGTLSAAYDWDQANIADAVKEYLSGHLD